MGALVLGLGAVAMVMAGSGDEGSAVGILCPPLPRSSSPAGVAAGRPGGVSDHPSGDDGAIPVTAEQVAAWTEGSASFARFADVLRQHEIDMVTLASVSEQALIAAGIPLGPAFKLKRCVEELVHASTETDSMVTRRKLHEAGPGACDLAELDATIQDVDLRCCQSTSQGHFRRFLQDSSPCSDVPDTCSSGCAAVFTPFFSSCQDYLAEALAQTPDVVEALEALFETCRESFEPSPPPPPAIAPIAPADAAQKFQLAEAAATRSPAPAMVSVVSEIGVDADMQSLTDQRHEFEEGFKHTMANSLGDGRTIHPDDVSVDELRAQAGQMFGGAGTLDPLQPLSEPVGVRFHITVLDGLQTTTESLMETLKESRQTLDIAVGNTVMVAEAASLVAPIWISASRRCLQDSVAAPPTDVPAGTVVMWTGAIENIPAGWAPCNGTDGTPDLRGRVPLGASVTNDWPVGTTVYAEYTRDIPDGGGRTLHSSSRLRFHGSPSGGRFTAVWFIMRLNATQAAARPVQAPAASAGGQPSELQAQLDELRATVAAQAEQIEALRSTSFPPRPLLEPSHISTVLNPSCCSQPEQATLTGNRGSTAYTISDLVAILKEEGMLKE
eukprot:COSAG04_NODE_1046_length_8572_cov_5.008970_7_plen_612_part_00